MSQAKRIAIIGAGISGAACAGALASAGLHVSLFDKSRGVGGRMSTRRGEGWQADHGAQYFRARDPLFQAEVARWEAAGAVAPWSGRITTLGADQAPSPDNDLKRFVGTPGMTAPARFAAREAHLLSSHTITRITRGDKGWELATSEHGTLTNRFDAVIVATPAPQAVPLLSQLDEKFASVAAQAVMLPCWALMLRYNQPIDLPFDGAFVRHNPIAWVARDSSKPARSGPETWVVHASAEWSHAHIESTPEEAMGALNSAFMALGAPAPDAISAHRWRFADVAPNQTHGFLWNESARLGVCGDWLNGGKVEGAWLSGHTLAKSMLET